MSSNRREFARIDVQLRARIQPVPEHEVEALQTRLQTLPSVWAPTNETRLRDLASSTAAGTDGILAHALLEMASEVVMLRARIIDMGGPMATATITQLSGGGGQMVSDLVFDLNDHVELRLDDFERGLPPIHAMIKILHRRGQSPDAYGFRFEAIHTRDQDRLIRFIYQLQRQAIREAQDSGS